MGQRAEAPESDPRQPFPGDGASSLGSRPGRASLACRRQGRRRPSDRPPAVRSASSSIPNSLPVVGRRFTAVGMANVLQQRGKVQILGVMSDIRNPVAVAAIDAIDSGGPWPSPGSLSGPWPTAPPIQHRTATAMSWRRSSPTPFAASSQAQPAVRHLPPPLGDPAEPQCDGRRHRWRHQSGRPAPGPVRVKAVRCEEERSWRPKL